MLASAREHYDRQQRIARRTLLAARRARLGTLGRLTSIVVAGQLLAARDAAAAVPLMLDEQNVEAQPVGEVDPAALAGVASDGRPLETLLDLTRESAAGAQMLDMIVLTQLADAARSSSSVAMMARPAVTGYARMLTPPSCSRCAVLAGRWYRKNAGFQRHPRCDCRAIPASEATAGDLATDPREYFDSLPTAADLADRFPDLTVKQRREMDLFSQEDIFTVHGAKAIRDGADISRVVNARAGMSTAQPPLRGRGDRWTASGLKERRRVFGQDVYTTTEATTRRGINRKVRLMPESIYEIAEDERDARRLLKAHGYLL